MGKRRRPESTSGLEKPCPPIPRRTALAAGDEYSHGWPDLKLPEVIGAKRQGVHASTLSIFGAYLLPLLVFIVYVKTMFPTVSGGDSGELLSAACSLGLAHPPGYPLWTMTAHVFSESLSVAFPTSSPAWRVGWFSAASNALATSNLYGICYQINTFFSDSFLPSRGSPRSLPTAPKELANIICHCCAILAAGLFAFSEEIWQYSIQAEVFSLNNLLLTWMFLSFFRFIRRVYEHQTADDVGYCANQENRLHSKTTSRRASEKRSFLGPACLVAFCCGLALSNQHISVFYVAVIAVYVLLHGGRLLVTPRSLACLSIAALAGLAPYLYLVIISHRGPPRHSWGDMSSLSGFLTHFLRAEYGTLRLASDEIGEAIGFQKMVSKLLLYAVHYQKQTMGIGLPLALFGVASCIQVHEEPRSRIATRKIWIPLIVCLVLYLLVLNFLANLSINNALYAAVLARMWQQADLLSSVFLSLGAMSIVGVASRLLSALFAKLEGGSILEKLSSLAALGSPVLVLALLTTHSLQSLKIFEHTNQKRVYQDFGLQILKAVPENGTLLLNGDIQHNTVVYLQNCEGIRPDVRAISVALITYPWWQKTQLPYHHPPINFPNKVYHPFALEGYSMIELLAANPKMDIYIAGPWKDGDPSVAKIYREPYFLVDKLFLHQNHQLDASTYSEKISGLLPSWSIPKSQSIRQGSWDASLFADVVNGAVQTVHLASVAAEKENAKATTAKLKRRHKLVHKKLRKVYKWLINATDPDTDLAPEIFVNAGIISGRLDAMAPAKKLKQEMLAYWAYYLQRAPQAMTSSKTSSLHHYVESGINPFIAQQTDDSLAFPDLAKPRNMTWHEVAKAVGLEEG